MNPNPAPRHTARRPLRTATVGAFALALLAHACAADAPNTSTTDARDAAVLAAWSEVLREVGTPTCQSDGQCRVAAVGARACGGPESFMAWSSAVSNEPALYEKLSNHRRAREARWSKDGLMSDCRALPQPAAACQRAASATSGLCVLSRPGTARAD